jgi:hypothetical protein
MKGIAIHKCLRSVLTGSAVALVGSAVPACGGYSSTSLIDVPASEYLDHLQYEADCVLAISADPAVSNYGVLNLNLGLGGMSEVGLAVYSLWDEAALGAHFKVEVIDEEHYSRFQPAVSVGMDHLTIGDGIISHAGDRLPGDTAAYDMDFRDNVSPFVVASKTIGSLGTFHLGWGYGRFTGGGPRSRLLHGIFTGYNVRIWRTFEIIVEEDGRDVNVGVRHILPWITVGAAVEKAEQLAGNFEPFYSLTVEFSPRPLHTGPERLEVRRGIRALEERVSFLRRQVGEEQELVSAVRHQVQELSEEYEDQGIEPANLKKLYAEIEELETALEPTGEEGEVAPGPGTGL